MKYRSLYKLFYIDAKVYKEEYNKRFNNNDTVHFDIKIGNNPAFLCQIPDLYKKVLSIERTDKEIINLCSLLPPRAIDQFAERCLIDEIVLTNNIEGVHSTRKEISEILNDLSKKNTKKRFVGLVNKYALLMKNDNISINTCEDIRQIYNDIFYNEIKDSDFEDLPDGKIFRKNNVSVYSQSNREIHHGITPESKIIDLMNKSLDILNDDTLDVFFRIAIFHYLFGYIHPFYDGNGRTSRFISSYLLSHNLHHIIGYRISYTIKEHVKSYYDAFKICNHVNNKGDLTPFVDMFLNIINISQKQLKEALLERVNAFNYYKESIVCFPSATNDKIYNIYFLLVQAALFSDIGISTSDLMKVLQISYNTLRNQMKEIPSKLIIKNKQGRMNYFLLNISEANSYIQQ